MKNSCLFFAMLGLIGFAAEKAQATQIDIVQGGYIVDGKLHSNVTDDQGNQIIEASSLSEEDAIVFQSSDGNPISIDGLDTSEFTLKGNVLLNTQTSIDSGSKLKVEGYLVDNTIMGTDFSDLSLGGGILSINDYVSGEGEQQTTTGGYLALSNGIKVGNVALYGDLVLQKDANDSAGEKIIDATGNFRFYQGVIASDDVQNSLLIKNSGGAFIVQDNVGVSGLALLKVNVPTQIWGRLSSLVQTQFGNTFDVAQGAGFSAQDVKFDGNLGNYGGNISVSGTSTFGGTVTNSGNSVMQLGGQATFAGDVTNSGNARMMLDGGTSFVNLTSNGNSVITANSGVTVSGNITAGDNAKMTFNKGVGVAGAVAISGTSVLSLNNTSSLNNVTVQGYAKIENNGEANFSGMLVNDEHGKIINDGNAAFSTVVTNSGNAKIINNGVALFNEWVLNRGNAEVELNGQTKFNKYFENIEDASFVSSGDTTFAMDVYNNNDASFTTNGTTVFDKNLYNQSNGVMVLGGQSNEIVQNLQNLNEATLYINGVTTVSGTTTNAAQAKIISSSEATFNNVNNSGNMSLNGATTYNGNLTNAGTITSTGKVEHKGTVINKDNASMDFSGMAVFAQAVANSGAMTMHGSANFESSLYNKGVFEAENSSRFAGNVTNVSGATMSLADFSFTDDNITLSNDGILNLQSSDLSNNIINNTDGELNFSGDVVLRNNWSSAGKINFLADSSIDLGSNRLIFERTEGLNFSDGTKLKFNIDNIGENQSGGRIDGNVNLIGNVSLLPTFANGITGGTYTFIDGVVDSSAGAWSNYNSNVLYDVALDGDGNISFSRKSNQEISENLGLSETEAEAVSAIIASNSDNAAFNNVANNVSEMLQSGDKGQLEKAKDIVGAISPEVSPMAQQAAVQITGQVFDVVGARLANRPFITTRYGRGMSSGDNAVGDGAAWVQGMGSQSELKDSDKLNGFESKTAGVAMGFEKQYSDYIRLGLGYAYSQTEIDGDLRNIDADTHSAIFYSEYKHPKFFLNFIASYGWSKYDETSLAASADYDVETMGMQAMAGYYALNTGVLRFIPEIGVRYVHTKQHDYESSIGAKYDNMSNDLLTGIVGARIAAIGGNKNGLRIMPEAKIAFTYDIENSDDNRALVVLPNGGSYSVLTKGMNRFGVEFGAGVTAELSDKVDISVNYEGKFRKDYHDHTGIVKGKYKF